MRLLWITLGMLAFFVGAIGVFLPVLPTTPFIILAAFAFGKGSTRLRSWLENNAIFGPIIRNWEADGVIAQRFKNIAYTLMALSFLTSIIAGLRPPILAIQGVCLGCAVLYISTRPSRPVI